MALPQIKALFPRNARLLWEMKAENDFVPLQAIKITTRDGKAPLDGGSVVDARQEFENNGSRPVVSMNMNGEGAKIWARLTKENVGHSIAIVLDGYVCSSPNVMNEINGGSSQITGRFDIKEAQDLANILKSGKLPAPARIIADEIAIGVVNTKTTAVRVIPVWGKGVGEMAEFGGLLGYAPIMPLKSASCEEFISRGGRIPAPIHSLKN